MNQRACIFIFGLLVASSCLAAEPGAKGLYYRQLSRPEIRLNTGLQYWLELKRGSKISQVSNKFDFRSGDRIRFHIKPNTDCYAYVMLKEGSKGEQAVLFPHPKHADNNRFHSGVDHIVPDDGYLSFDANPGVEKVFLLLSREPLDPEKFLRDHTNQHVLITSRASGAKDLVPGSFVVDIDPATSEPPVQLPIIAPEPSAITVVQKDPTAVLALDVLLTHRQ